MVIAHNLEELKNLEYINNIKRKRNFNNSVKLKIDTRNIQLKNFNIKNPLQELKEKEEICSHFNECNKLNVLYPERCVYYE